MSTYKHYNGYILTFLNNPEKYRVFSFLIKQHFEHYELINPFFNRTAIILAFYKDLGCRIFIYDRARMLQLLDVDLVANQLCCKVVSGVEKSAMASDRDSNSFFVKLPKALAQYVSLLPESVVTHGSFFASQARAIEPEPISNLLASFPQNRQGKI